jgi:hypothetical protein
MRVIRRDRLAAAVLLVLLAVAFIAGTPFAGSPNGGLILMSSALAVIHRELIIALAVMMLWTAPPPARECQEVGAARAPTIRRSQMQTVTTVDLDIAKSVFQVHCVDAAGQVDVSRSGATSSRFPEAAAGDLPLGNTLRTDAQSAKGWIEPNSKLRQLPQSV